MQTNNQPNQTFFMKKHFFIVLSGIVFSLFITYFIVSGDAVETVSPSTLELIVAGFVGIINAYAFYLLSNFLDKLLPWHKQEGNRLLAGIFIHYISSLILTFSLLYLGGLLFPDNLEFSSMYQAYAVKLSIVLFIMMLIFEIIYFALYSYYSYTTFQIETVRQERKQIELQLKALKAQLSPHFLFNSLNTISSLVFKDKGKAENFVRKLAEMYQYTLNSYRIKLTSLEEELEFVKSYIHLLETRYGNKFHCDVQIPSSILQTKIPPLTLQMLIENAVKHNVLHEDNPLKVKIYYDKKYISVTNNVTEEPKHVTSFKIGLKNINTRYLLLHTEGILVTNGSTFEVKIPILS